MAEEKKKPENQKRSKYIEGYIPLGGWILVEKDMTPEQIGRVHVPSTFSKANIRTASTGIIIAMSPFKKLETEDDEYRSSLMHVGDWVGFSNTTPTVSPSPPNYELERQDANDIRFVTLHISDIICVLCKDAEVKKEFLGRFK